MPNVRGSVARSGSWNGCQSLAATGVGEVVTS
jgi:hypothetical protein